MPWVPCLEIHSIFVVPLGCLACLGEPGVWPPLSILLGTFTVMTGAHFFTFV